MIIQVKTIDFHSPVVLLDVLFLLFMMNDDPGLKADHLIYTDQVRLLLKVKLYAVSIYLVYLAF